MSESGFINETDIERVRESADIVEIIGDYVKLKRSGRNYQGLCPFHDEKTPSFSVSPDMQLFHCFGCKASGNVFHFVMRAEGIVFPDAVERLALKYGISIQRKSKVGREAEDTTKKLIDATAFANRFFRGFLKSPDGERFRKYLFSRGVENNTAERFEIGAAPPKWDALVRAAVRNGFDIKDLEKAGLAFESNKYRGSYIDRFRDRIIFPIKDNKGRIVAFGGRTIGETKEGVAKYVNSPETSLYFKGRILYNLSDSRKAILDVGNVLVVEGYIDAIMLYQKGFANVIATCGTALTEEHSYAISRLTDRVVLAFDSDEAGLQASARAASVFRKYDVDLRLIEMPEDQDPADLCGVLTREEIEEMIQKARSAYEVLIEAATKVEGKPDINNRSRAMRSGALTVHEISRPEMAEDLLRLVANRTGFSIQEVTGAYKSKNFTLRNEKVPEQVNTAYITNPIEDELLSILSVYPKLISEYGDLINEEHFKSKELLEIAERIKKLVKDSKKVHASIIVEGLSERARERFSQITQIKADYDLDSSQNAVAGLFARMRERVLVEVIDNKKTELEKAVRVDSDNDKARSLQKELMALEREKRYLREIISSA